MLAAAAEFRHGETFLEKVSAYGLEAVVGSGGSGQILHFGTFFCFSQVLSFPLRLVLLTKDAQQYKIISERTGETMILQHQLSLCYK